MATDDDWTWSHMARGSVPPEPAPKAPRDHRPHWLEFLVWLRDHGAYADDVAPSEATVPPERIAAPEPRPPMTAGDGDNSSYLP